MLPPPSQIIESPPPLPTPKLVLKFAISGNGGISAVDSRYLEVEGTL